MKPAIVKIDGVEKKRVWIDEVGQVIEVDQLDADFIKALKTQWKDNTRVLTVTQEEVPKQEPKKKSKSSK